MIKGRDIWRRIGPRFLPFADAGTAEMPLGRLLRLSLFQVGVGMTAVLLTGTLNRVMIVELGVSAALVAVMAALPFLLAPARALIGFRSDHHRSVLGWRRVPYIWFGSILQFGGLAIMPFALLLLQSRSMGPEWIGPAAAAFAFLVTGAGVHMVQTAGLALATDLAPERVRPRAVALLYAALLAGMIVAALVFGLLLDAFSPLRLIQVVQGSAVAVMVLNFAALWKQEPRRAGGVGPEPGARPSFAAALARLRGDRRARRLLTAIALGVCGFSMQDVLLEPYGGEVLGMSVGETTMLTALLAGGTLAGFALAARLLGRGGDPRRMAASGALIGVLGFSAVTFSAPFAAVHLFACGVGLIGMGGGLFAVATLIACMDRAEADGPGLALGAWGAVQASAVGIGLAAGGLTRDVVAAFTPGDPAFAYLFVYHLEIGFLAASIVAIGPIVRFSDPETPKVRPRIGLTDIPT